MFQACHILSFTIASYAIIFRDNFYSALEIVLCLMYGKNVIAAFKLNEKIVKSCLHFLDLSLASQDRFRKK